VEPGSLHWMLVGPDGVGYPTPREFPRKYLRVPFATVADEDQMASDFVSVCIQILHPLPDLVRFSSDFWETWLKSFPTSPPVL
jgi:hypothetical protein